MATKTRTDSLTTVQLHNLDEACNIIKRGLGQPYLVGTAGIGGGTYRDVDVRVMLADAEFAAVCPNQVRWELLCLAISTYLSERTGLPIDFQIQLASVANEAFPDSPRNPLGMRRPFAGLGDGTSQPWPTDSESEG